MYDNILVMILLVIAFATLWFMYCNSRTFDDRAKIRDTIRAAITEDNGEKAWDMIAVLSTVSYNQHLVYRFTFRDPMKLYRGLEDG